MVLVDIIIVIISKPPALTKNRWLILDAKKKIQLLRASACCRPQSWCREINLVALIKYLTIELAQH